MSNSRRRLGPTPTNTPVGGTGDQHLNPPEEFNPAVLASTDPDEAPPPVPDDVPVTPVVAAEDPPVELSPEEEVMFASLLTCGRRSKVVRVFDHTVVVQTLCGDDDLRIGMYVKDYQGSLGEQRAYQIGVAAAGIRTIDGQPLVQSLYAEADDDALFDQKLAKVAKMYPTVISQIYRTVIDAEKEFVELAATLGKLHG